MQGNSQCPPKTHGFRHRTHAQKKPRLWGSNHRQTPALWHLDLRGLLSLGKGEGKGEKGWAGRGGGSTARTVIHRWLSSDWLVHVLSSTGDSARAPLPTSPITSILKTAETWVELTQGYRGTGFSLQPKLREFKINVLAHELLLLLFYCECFIWLFLFTTGFS